MASIISNEVHIQIEHDLDDQLEPPVQGTIVPIWSRDKVRDHLQTRIEVGVDDTLTELCEVPSLDDMTQAELDEVTELDYMFLVDLDEVVDLDDAALAELCEVVELDEAAQARLDQPTVAHQYLEATRANTGKNSAFELIVPQGHVQCASSRPAPEVVDQDTGTSLDSTRPKKVQEIMEVIRETVAQRDSAHTERDQAVTQTELIAQQHDVALDRIELLALQREMLLEQNQQLIDGHEELDRDLEEARTSARDRLDQRNEAIKKLAHAIHQRNMAATRIKKSIEERDEALNRLEELTKDRDIARAKLEEVSRECSMAMSRYNSTRKVIEQWKLWRIEAQEKLDASQERAEWTHHLAMELVNTPWWALRRRKGLRVQIMSF